MRALRLAPCALLRCSPCAFMRLDHANPLFEPWREQKYLLNSASIGYANKFKSLLLCGSVVIYVREGIGPRALQLNSVRAEVRAHALGQRLLLVARVRWLHCKECVHMLF